MILSAYSIGILVSFCCYEQIQGVYQYGRCNRYDYEEYVDPSRCAMCIEDNNNEGFRYMYCRHYECQQNTCGDRAVRNGMCCASCPGTCNYGGTVYAIGDRFPCLDGVNNCQCTGTGMVTRRTMRSYNKDDLCEMYNREGGFFNREMDSFNNNNGFFNDESNFSNGENGYFNSDSGSFNSDNSFFDNDAGSFNSEKKRK